MLVVNEKDPNAATLASEFLHHGKVISFSTDTVYALAADASNFKAVETLYQIKNRDPKKPIAIFVKDLDAAKKIFFFDKKAEEIAKKFLPGALTLVLETRDKAFSYIASNLNQNSNNFLGFRVVDKFFVKELFKKFDGILAVTSANISGATAATNPDEIKNILPNIDLLIKGEISHQPSSTVAKIIDNKVIILRQGPVIL